LNVTGMSVDEMRAVLELADRYDVVDRSLD
jgi:hypothetical protein